MWGADGKVLIVWDRIGDYHRARIQALREQSGSGRVLTADLGGQDSLYGWEGSREEESHFVLSPAPVDQRDYFRRCRRFWSICRRHGVVWVALSGYGKPEYLLFILLARLLGCRVTLFAESWYGTAAFRDRLKGWFLRLGCHRFFVSGQRAWDHFHERLGIPARCLFSGYSVVDNSHFDRIPEPSEEAVLLCVARFSPEKNLDLLIRAFQRSELAAGWKLRLIGGGPEEEALRRLDDGSAVIEFAGWVGYAELPAEYARARAFILPSRFEPWGLVVNEAMAARLPVIVSDACGCVPDLVREGSNGFTFRAGDENSLRAALNRLAGLELDQFRGMGIQSGLIISDFSCQAWADTLIASFAES